MDDYLCMKELKHIYESILDNDFVDNTNLDDFIKNPFKALYRNTKNNVKTMDDWNELVKIFQSVTDTETNQTNLPEVIILWSKSAKQYIINIKYKRDILAIRPWIRYPNKLRFFINYDPADNKDIVTIYYLDKKYVKMYIELFKAWKNAQIQDDYDDWYKWRDS